MQVHKVAGEKRERRPSIPAPHLAIGFRKTGVQRFQHRYVRGTEEVGKCEGDRGGSENVRRTGEVGKCEGDKRRF